MARSFGLASRGLRRAPTSSTMYRGASAAHAATVAAARAARAARAAALAARRSEGERRRRFYRALSTYQHRKPNYYKLGMKQAKRHRTVAAA